VTRNLQVYPFNSTINAFESAPANHTFHLTQSFRFGPEIAYVANAFLSTQKNPEQTAIVGGRKEDFIILRSSEINPKLKDFRPVAILGRRWGRLLNEVDKLVCSVDGSDRPSAALVGGLESYDLDDYLDIYHLIKGENLKMKKWQTLQSIQSLEGIAWQTENGGTAAPISIVIFYRIGHLCTLVVPKFIQPNYGNFLNKSSGIKCKN
jgi:hypothetical protein